MKSLKDEKDWFSYFETYDFNMVVDLDEDKRKEILIEKIQSKWNNKIGKFVNIYKIIFEPQILIFAYADTIKSKGANSRGGDKVDLDGVHLQRIIKLSQSIMDGF